MHRRGPGPGSRRSSLEKPSRTRAGGRGERRGVLHCLEEKEKTKSWVNARILQVSIIVRQNLCQNEHLWMRGKNSEISSLSRILDAPAKLFVSENTLISNVVNMIPLATQPSSFIKSINVFDAKN